jgi:hypothetical protein
MHNPFVPETLEGWSCLHLMYRVRWDRVRSTDESARQQMAEEAVNALAVPDAGSTAFVQLLGHKGDLMVDLFPSRLRGTGARAARVLAHGAARSPRADDVVRVRRGARDVRDDREDPRAARGEAQTGQRGVRQAFDAEMETQRSA